MNLEQKLDLLKKNIKKIDKMAIAFSGGVDSTFLLKIAHDLLGENVIAVTAKSSFYPEREFNEAVDFVNKQGIRHIVINPKEFENKSISDNPKNRCYLCKKELFSKILDIAKQYEISYVAEGSNVDDLKDYRPGMKALKELNILSPLKQAGFLKNEIRELLKKMNISTWDKPSSACLASRIPYRQKITVEKLKMVELAEQYLKDIGFKQVRVRHHEDTARIEVSENERTKFIDEKIMNDVYKKLKAIGFNYVALDLKGYRTGSLNEIIE